MTETKLHIALYQPDIPQNVGAAMRLCACMNIPLDIIEPCGFPWNKQKIQRSGMDYMYIVELYRHDSWEKFIEKYKNRRLVLMTTKTDTSYLDFKFTDKDIIIAGQESSGVPKEVNDLIQHHITIPMSTNARSMNVINATSMITGEALRQTNKTLKTNEK